MYETGTAVSVRSFHVMPGMPPPEGERHFHDYRLEVVVSRSTLEDRGMVGDLDVLDAGLRALAARLAGADLEKVLDVEVVTVEVFAAWLHGEVAAAIGPGVTLRVRVWESPVAFGGYAAP